MLNFGTQSGVKKQCLAFTQCLPKTCLCVQLKYNFLPLGANGIRGAVLPAFSEVWYGMIVKVLNSNFNYLYCNKYVEGVINLENFNNSFKSIILVA